MENCLMGLHLNALHMVLSSNIYLEENSFARRNEGSLSSWGVLSWFHGVETYGYFTHNQEWELYDILFVHTIIYLGYVFKKDRKSVV